MFRCGCTTIRCFFVTSSFLQKGWQVPKASCPRRQHASYPNPYPCSGGLQTGFKGFKDTLHFFFPLQVMHRLPCSPLLLLTGGTGCLWFACCSPQGQALLPDRTLSYLLLNKKCRTWPAHGGGGRSATSTRAPPGIQDQDQDLKRSKCICCGADDVLLADRKLLKLGIKWGKNAGWNLLITLIWFC